MHRQHNNNIFQSWDKLALHEGIPSIPVDAICSTLRYAAMEHHSQEDCKIHIMNGKQLYISSNSLKLMRSSWDENNS